MQEYTYTDFIDALNDTGKRIAEAIHGHIAESYPEYKPYGILPKNRDKKEWSLFFRKHPKHGKPLCALFSNDGALSIRCTFFSPMMHKLLLRQEEFGKNIRAEILRAGSCGQCGRFGDKQFCWVQHHFFVNEKLSWMCGGAWFEINDIEEGDLSDNDLNDFLHLIDIQSKHMAHSARETQGAGYNEENLLRCGEVSDVKLERTELDIDVFDPADYTDIKRLDKYARAYNLTPMGESNGLWFYLDERAICGTPDEGYRFTAVPEGAYANIKVSDPFTFSAIRAWDYVCLWIRRNEMSIASADIGGTKTPMLVKFYRQGEKQFMDIYVQIKNDRSL